MLKYTLRTLVIAIAFACGLAGSAQTPATRTKSKVAINTTTPTENFDVNGTMRVRTLPIYEKGGTSTPKIGTDASGNEDPNFGQNFVPSHYVMVDKNGVLGKAVGVRSEFFYMPAVVLPTSATQATGLDGITYSGGVYTVNLYEIYARQFGLNTGANIVSNSSALSIAPLEPNNAGTYDYFITYYDDKVFDNVAVSDAGILTYKVKAATQVTPKTFMNIVFKVK